MIKVRQREVYEARQWFPGENVPGVGLYRVVGQESPKYLLQSWPGGAELYSINPGDWVLASARGHRFALDDATFRRAYIEVQP
jgi:hypothetical protein